MTRTESDSIAARYGLKPAGGGYIGGLDAWAGFAIHLRSLLEQPAPTRYVPGHEMGSHPGDCPSCGEMGS